MQELKINITNEELNQLQILAELREVTAEFIIEMFVADLTASNRSNGADERGYISNWFNRNNNW